MSKKEIRIYFNLNDSIESKIYNYLTKDKKASMLIKDMTLKHLEDQINKNLIADKLDLVIAAIQNLNTISIVPGEQTHTEEKEEFNFNLVDQFDDEY